MAYAFLARFARGLRGVGAGWRGASDGSTGFVDCRPLQRAITQLVNVRPSAIAAFSHASRIRNAAEEGRARDIGRAGDDANRERESFGGLLHASLCTILSRAGIVNGRG
jgi:hypothetical protein